MNKMLLAVAAIVLSSGAALADSAQASSNDRYGDAAPTVAVVAGGQIDRAGVAAIQAPVHAPGFNDRYGDAQPSQR